MIKKNFEHLNIHIFVFLQRFTYIEYMIIRISEKLFDDLDMKKKNCNLENINFFLFHILELFSKLCQMAIIHNFKFPRGGGMILQKKIKNIPFVVCAVMH